MNRTWFLPIFTGWKTGGKPGVKPCKTQSWKTIFFSFVVTTQLQIKPKYRENRVITGYKTEWKNQILKSIKCFFSVLIRFIQVLTNSHNYWFNRITGKNRVENRIKFRDKRHQIFFSFDNIWKKEKKKEKKKPIGYFGARTHTRRDNSRFCCGRLGPLHHEAFQYEKTWVLRI